MKNLLMMRAAWPPTPAARPGLRCGAAGMHRRAAGVAGALLVLVMAMLMAMLTASGALAANTTLYAQNNALPDTPPEPALQSTHEIGIARALDAVLERALSLRGTRYRAGGTSPETGFDCSGFVGFLYRDIVGFQLPRSAHEIWRFGKTVERAELRPGDLVFYNTMRRPYSHVGIYLGGNQFVHAPASGGVVRVVNMDERYWTTRWNGAKRVAP